VKHLGPAPVLTIVAFGVTLLGCTPKVVHRCPTQKNCTHPSHRASPRATPSPRRHTAPAQGYAFRKPGRYALPTSIRQPRSVAFSPQAKLVAVGGRWGRLEVVRIRDGRSLYTLGRTDELVRGLLVRFTPSGRHLVSARHKLTRVRIWDSRSGHLVREIRAKGYPIRDLTLTKDHRVILATSAGVEIWSSSTGRHERTLKMRYDLPVTRVAASPSGYALAGDRAGNVLLFSPADGSRHGRLTTPGKRLSALDLAADGTLAVVAYQNGMVHLASTAPFRRVRRFSWWTRGTPLRVGFAARKRTVVVADSTGRIEHVDAERGKLLYRQHARTKTQDDVALSADGQLLASAARSGGVELWQSEEAGQRLTLPRRVKRSPLHRPKPTLSIVHPVRIDLEIPGVNIASFAVGKRGTFLAVAGKPTQIGVYYLVTRPRRRKRPFAKRLYLRKPRKPPKKKTVTREPLQVAITPDRNWLFATGAGFYLDRWALLTGRHLRRRFHEKTVLRSLLPTHNSRQLITVGPGRQVFGWNLRGQRVFRLNGITNPYWVGVSRRGRTFVQIQGWDRMVAFGLPSGKRLWDNASGPLAEFEVVALRFTKDSQKLITFHKTGFLRYRDVATGTLLTRIRIPLAAPPTLCDIRPDAKVMACATREGVALLELPSGALVRTLRIRGSHRSAHRIRAIGYSPRGNTLVVQTGRQKLVVYNFDHPGKAIRYTGIDARVRVRLGLPIVAPRIHVKPGRVPKPDLLKPTKPLRFRQPRTPPRRR
jgi:WD40 repeat protein